MGRKNRTQVCACVLVEIPREIKKMLRWASLPKFTVLLSWRLLLLAILFKLDEMYCP